MTLTNTDSEFEGKQAGGTNLNSAPQHSTMLKTTSFVEHQTAARQELPFGTDMNTSLWAPGGSTTCWGCTCSTTCV